jgi:heterodisulfide reductase subunit B
MAQKAGADCLVVACPLCQVNLDLRQADAAKAHGAFLPIPVLYITQLLGIALGLPMENLGLDSLTVDAKDLFAERDSAAAGFAGGKS